MYGTIHYARTILVPEDRESAKKLQDSDGKKAVVPLDDALMVGDLPFRVSCRAMSEIARTAAMADSYADAAERLSLLFGENISISTVERVTDYVGSLMDRRQCEMAEEAGRLARIRKIDTRKIRRQADDVLYIEAGGGRVHVRDREHAEMNNEEIRQEHGAGRKKPEHEMEWTESRHAICFHSRDIRYCFRRPDGTTCRGRTEDLLKAQETGIQVLGCRIENRDCVAYISSPDQFLFHVLALAERNRWASCSTVVILSDGSEWVGKLKETVLLRKIKRKVA